MIIASPERPVHFGDPERVVSGLQEWILMWCSVVVAHPPHVLICCMISDAFLLTIFIKSCYPSYRIV